MKDAIHDRGKALEDLFYHNRDQILLEKLKEDMHREEEFGLITAATGIADREVLGRLLDANIDSHTLASFSMVPLVVVAWADGSVAASEREAILSAAEDSGISNKDGSRQLLESWLKQPPESTLLETWKEYVHALKLATTEEDYAHLKSQVLGRAHQVAEAAGGFLGMGNKTSKSEQVVLDDLEATFGP